MTNKKKNAGETDGGRGEEKDECQATINIFIRYNVKKRRNKLWLIEWNFLIHNSIPT